MSAERGAKPCPFCGGKPLEPELVDDFWDIYCIGCEFSGPHAGAHGWNRTREHAIAAWNRRAEPGAKERR